MSFWLISIFFRLPKSRFTTEKRQTIRQWFIHNKKYKSLLQKINYTNFNIVNHCAARVFSVLRRYALYRTHVRRRDRIGEMQLPF